MRVCAALLLTLLSTSGLGAQEAPAGKEPFALSLAARHGDRFRMLLRQFRADEPELQRRREAGERPAVAEYQGARDIPAGYWVWVEPYWFVFRDGPDDEVAPRSWGTEQACGAPDVPQPGDHGSAWATRAEDAAGEWLLLEYARPVRAARLEVHESFKPGALESIAILDAEGQELEVWRTDAAGPVADAGRVLRIDLPLGFTVERLKLRFRSELVPGWNEIDAVGLHDDKGKVHWAARAEASSTYADVQGPARRGVVRKLRVVEMQEPMPVGVFRARGEAGRWADADEAAALRAKVAELEAKVAALQAELERLRAAQPRK